MSDSNIEANLNNLFDETPKSETLIESAMGAIKKGDLTKLMSIARSIPKNEVSEVLSGQYKNGDTCLNKAIEIRNIPIAKFLLEECHVDPIARYRHFNYSLNIAIKKDQLEIVKMLIKSKAKLDVSCTKYYTLEPLWIACIKPDKRILDYLIRNCEDIDHSKCLASCFKHLNPEHVKYLLECGADLSYKDLYGLSPLHRACKHGAIENLKLLINKGVDHYSLHDGLTPIQVAALNCQEKVVSFYFYENYYTQQEVWDSFELLGVGSVLHDDLGSALKFWNKVLIESPQHNKRTSKSSFLRIFQRDSKKIKNYGNFILDLEDAAIHSIMVIEKVIGLKHLLIHNEIDTILDLIPIKNIRFWKALVGALSEYFDYRSFYTFHQHFMYDFKTYIQRLHYKNIDSSLLKIFYDFVDVSLQTEDFICSYFSRHILSMVCLYSIKDNIEYSDYCFHTIVKIFLNSKGFSFESPLHALIKEGITWEFPDRVLYETFELCCKLSESVNILNGGNETPLHAVLSDAIGEESSVDETLWNDLTDGFIDVLLKHGALTDTKNKRGKTFRELAIQSGRESICIGSPSLQTQVNTKLGKDTLKNLQKSKDLSEILKYYIKYH